MQKSDRRVSGDRRCARLLQALQMPRPLSRHSGLWQGGAMTLITLVFDAYGTLFDVSAAARRAAQEPDFAALQTLWPRLAEDWRRKQLEYNRLRSLMGVHADFATVTADALDWALATQKLHDPALRTRLLALYDHLETFPEVPSVLATLKTRGLTLAILSNGTPAMLTRAATTAGIADMFAAVISVEPLQTYKPTPAVYALVQTRLGPNPDQVLFVSSNGWDIAGAGQFGFATAWINRSGAPVDRLPHRPTRIHSNLTGLLDTPA